MKTTIIPLGIILLLNLSSCGGDNEKDTHQGEEVQYGKWFKPSQNICENNGGTYYDGGIGYEMICSSNLENAKKICSISGGVLPTLETLQKVVTDCGGEFVYTTYPDGSWYPEEGKTLDGLGYRTCYREKGFISSYPLYLSSTIAPTDTSAVWYVDFSLAKINYYDKNDGFDFLCIKNN